VNTLLLDTLGNISSKHTSSATINYLTVK